MKAAVIMIAVIVLSSMTDNALSSNSHFVPNEVTAQKIAVAVLESLVGEEALERQEIIQTVLEDNVWIISFGPRPESKNETIMGGGLQIKIDRTTGTILGWGFLP